VREFFNLTPESGLATLPTATGCSGTASNWTDPDTGIEWCVLIPATDPRGGIGNALIITRDTVVSSTHTNIITATDSWFDNAANVSPSLRAATMNTQVPPARGLSTTPSTGENTFMLPQPGTMGAGRAFSLSQVEAAEYFATNADRVPHASTIPNNTGWFLRTGNTNFTTGGNTGPASIWGGPITGPHAATFANHAGSIANSSGGGHSAITCPTGDTTNLGAVRSTTCGVRPAVWISVN